jgi:hypothetical protein
MRDLTYLAFTFALALTAAPPAARAVDAEGLPNGKDVSGPPSTQDCLRDLQAFDEQLWKVGFGVLPPEGYDDGFGTEPIPTTPRQKIEVLRNAAYVYVRVGDEQSCERELAAMRAIFDEHQKVIRARTGDPNMAVVWRRAHLAGAKPVAEMGHLMRAEVLVGSEVRNLKDERLGEISDIVLNPAEHKILYVLVARGGFLGIGTKLVAVRWSDLRATNDHELYVLDVPPKAVEDAPKVDPTDFATTAGAEWLRLLNQYWDGVLK